MKTAMKRLLSFVLVAMMLVSVVPFQASAATMPAELTIKIWGPGADGKMAEYGDTATLTVSNGEFTAAQVQALAYEKCKDEYEETGAYVKWADADDPTYTHLSGAITAEDLPKDENGEAKTVSEIHAVFPTRKAPATPEETTWTAKVVTTGNEELGKFTFDSALEAAQIPAKAEEYAATEIPSVLAKIGDGDDAFYTKKTDWTVVGTNTVVYTVQPKTCELTLIVNYADEDGDAYGTPETKKVTVAYGSEYTLKVSDVVGYDEELVTVGKWTGNLSDNSPVAVVGNATYEITLTDNGWRTSNLWEKKSVNGKYEFAGLVYWKPGQQISKWKDAPNLSDTVTFKEWNSQENGKGKPLPSGYLDDDTFLFDDYYAQYETEYNNGDSKVKVHASYFVDGILHHTAKNVFEMEISTGDKVFDEKYLGNSGNISYIKNQIDLDANKDTFDLVKWNGADFYTDEDCEKEASTSLKATGTTNLYIRIDADKDEIASVHLYVHKKVSSSYVDIIKMKGYLAGDLVSAKDAVTAVKAEDWRASDYKMYSDTDWEHLLAGATNVGEVSTVTVEADGSVDIHILLKNGYKTEADSSNPKTGDTILMAVTALGISASALAVLYFYNKKKQSV